ncbi:MAG TPA: SUMF1/EgtB/PvdO family nonheme iron enzyme, partial [Bacteroidia bacterium]|nr:SUMF1/EgtB/PvdO family nonheme iron enzyme [Bacteroidia bacterium]
ISRYLESNGQYCAYLSFLKQHHEAAAYVKALPDTLFWKKLIHGEDDTPYLCTHYLRDPEFANYPVLGVSAAQVNAYANWKSDRVNEMILIHEGILEFVENDTTKDYFNTMAYLTGKPYTPHSEHFLDSVRHLPPENAMLNRHTRTRGIRMEDGIFLPSYTIPTIQEWKYAMNSSVQSRKEANQKAVKMKQSRYDKKGHFPYLFPDAHRYPETSAHKQLRYLGITPVQEEEKGDFLLCSMDKTIGEWVSDNTEQSVLNSGTKYRIRGGHSSETNKPISVIPSGTLQTQVLIGFRLVLPDYQ